MYEHERQDEHVTEDMMSQYLLFSNIWKINKTGICDWQKIAMAVIQFLYDLILYPY